jgi:hypothetical protein
VCWIPLSYINTLDCITTMVATTYALSLFISSASGKGEETDTEDIEENAISITTQIFLLLIPACLFSSIVTCIAIFVYNNRIYDEACCGFIFARTRARAYKHNTFAQFIGWAGVIFLFYQFFVTVILFITLGVEDTKRDAVSLILFAINWVVTLLNVIGGFKVIHHMRTNSIQLGKIYKFLLKVWLGIYTCLAIGALIILIIIAASLN